MARQAAALISAAGTYCHGAVPTGDVQHPVTREPTSKVRMLPNHRQVQSMPCRTSESLKVSDGKTALDQFMYKGGVMVYARFDASVPSITDEVIFDELDPSTMAWYVSISTDNRFLLFAKDGAIMQHNVETGETMKVSAESDPYKAYPTYTTFSK